MISLSEYALTDVVHEGASVVVHRGYRKQDRAKVIVKRLRAESPDPMELAKLRHEHATLQGLAIAGVPRVHGLATSERGVALVLEDAGGRVLCDLLRERDLDLRTALEIAVALAGILEVLHQRRIVHRDIKPHNILFDLESRAIGLIDFGISARLAQEVHAAGSPESLEGTLAYISPEQTGRTSRLVDHRSDLYSLGVTLYEMLTSSLPFRSADPAELVHSHIARTPAPPCELSPHVPGVVSDIVMKLLSKAPEDRYQSAHGLRVDLEGCLEQLARTGRIEPFRLGERDLSGELRVPQRLYGREVETAALLSAFERAAQGATELVMVRGPAGVGKSALIKEVQHAIARRCGGYFISGKSDQLDRNVPYAPFQQALRELIRQIMVEPAEALARWRDRLTAALGENGQVMVDLLPELAWIIGPQPSVPELGPTEAQVRCNMVFQRFMRALGSSERPFALFLDDLQWADPASLNLLKVILGNMSGAHLLVIGAARDHEVDEGHPLSLALGDIRSAGATVSELPLGPLGLADVNQLLSDTLRCEPRRSAPLAALLFEKAHGNPFYLNQLLRRLREQELITLDRSAEAWTWDLGRIEDAPITDNVVELMVETLRKLAPETQEVLKLAACFGHQFDLQTLSLAHERPPSETAAHLWGALDEGLVLPLSADYRFYHDEGARGAESPEAETRNVSYRFLHDRVQEAAYSLIEPARRPEAHLRIGRLLLAQRERAKGDGETFEIVDHMNLGASLLSSEEERLALARMNLTAARRARSAAAFEAAFRYLEAGVSVLDGPLDGWERDGELTLALHMDLAECEFLTRRFERALSRCDVLLGRARARLQQVRVHELRMTVYMAQGRYADAMDAGLAGLALFGIELPETDEQLAAVMEAELADVQKALGGRRIEELIDAPPMTDPDKKALLKFLLVMVNAAHATQHRLFAFLIVRQVNISLRDGHSDASPSSYVTYGFYLSACMGRHGEAYEFGKLAIDLNDRLNNPEMRCKLNVQFAVYSHRWRPFREALPYLERAYDAGLQSGDFFLPYGCIQMAEMRLALGEELGAMREVIASLLALVQRLKDRPTTAALWVMRQMVANLTGQTRSRDSLSDDASDEASFVATLPELPFAAVWYYVIKLRLCYLYEDPQAALAMADLAAPMIGIAGCIPLVDALPFYTALSIFALPDAGERARRGAEIAAHEARLARLAESCPENYRHRHQLVLAEAARVAGREVEAMARYDEAISGARDGGFVHEEALANELCARFLAAAGKVKAARVYMTEAHDGYLRWGATAKASHLAERHPHLLQEAAAPPPPSGDRWSSASMSTTGARSAALLDAATILRAAQAISSELVLEHVLERLMRLVLESAGAQRGALLLAREGQLLVEATATVEPNNVLVGLSRPLEQSDDIAQAVVRYVARTREPVILGAAAQDTRFAADPYVVERRPRSVLCLSLSHRGRLTGVLYLENNAAFGAFTPSRLEVCEMLSSQAAIAVENALLYARIEATSADLRRTNEGLEGEVGRRTAELREANERLARELVERERAEATRAALQQEILRVKDARLAEMSTPLIPISDHIMVMPLVGTVDAPRALQVMETALQGVQARGAGVVILDITGVKLIDTEVASLLLRTADALRLLGARTVLTGISPRVAQTLVAMGLDLGRMVTKQTLQSGIAYAMGRSAAA
ncbi:AAA family ATPase [Sorangium sp. So ce1389]|uniref:AAA family ATPase n=1 Tax=Sorangium sp. So ce1389 TaxID=3133336 RepID=UPI003F63F8C6